VTGGGGEEPMPVERGWCAGGGIVVAASAGAQNDTRFGAEGWRVASECSGVARGEISGG